MYVLQEVPGKVFFFLLNECLDHVMVPATEAFVQIYPRLLRANSHSAFFFGPFFSLPQASGSFPSLFVSTMCVTRAVPKGYRS